MNIVPYNFIDSERLRFGKFPVLDTILYRWARKIEETLFEQVGIEVYAGASVVEEIKFSTFLAMLKQPRPIYFFTIEPLYGQGLFVLDNRFSTFCLQKSADPPQNRRQGRLSPENQALLQETVQRMMKDFDYCWSDIHPVHTRLKKITTHPFRARILNSYESCMMAQIHLSGRNISSRIAWCWARTQLEPVLPRLRESKVLPPMGVERLPGSKFEREKLLERLQYTLRLRMGRVELSEVVDKLEVGGVVALDKAPEENAVVAVEGTPVWMASIGQVEGNYAFKVDGAYSPPRTPTGFDSSEFHPLRWPAVSPD